MKKEAVLKVIKGNMAGEEFVFAEEGSYLIGRSPSCALQIQNETDMKISRRHLLLILDSTHVRVRDLNSRNGTTVNGEILAPGEISDEPEKMTPVDKILKKEDIVSIGDEVFTIELISQRPSGVIPLTKKSPITATSSEMLDTPPTVTLTPKSEVSPKIPNTPLAPTQHSKSEVSPKVPSITPTVTLTPKSEVSPKIPNTPLAPTQHSKSEVSPKVPSTTPTITLTPKSEVSPKIPNTPPAPTQHSKSEVSSKIPSASTSKPPSIFSVPTISHDKSQLPQNNKQKPEKKRAFRSNLSDQRESYQKQVTTVMSAKEFENLNDLALPIPEKKRVAKFKVKKPSKL